MITTIIITICSTLFVVGLITLIAVAYYKLGKRLKKEEFDKEIENLHKIITMERDDFNTRISQSYDDFGNEINLIKDEIDLIYKKIDSRFDRLNTRIDKLIKSIEEVNGDKLKLTETNI